MRVLRVSHSAVVDAWRERERRLETRGVHTHVVSSLEWDEGGARVPLTARPGEAVTGVRTLGRHPALFGYDPRPLWRLLGESWDVLEIHEEPFALATAEILGLRLLRRSRVPYSLYSAQNLRKRYPVPFRWLERGALRGAAGLSVCNAEAGRICVDKGFPGRPRLIPLGLDRTAFRPGARRAPTSTIVVGFAGRLASHKGVDVLLAAIATDDRLHLRVAGAGPDAEALRRTATQLQISARITWLGAVRQSELADFYRSLDVLAVPSLTTPSWVEQFGRVVVEAMACGVPVVASDSGALPEVVAGAGLLVAEGDPVALGEALTRVGTDAGLASSLRRAGLARAAECDWDAVADAYLDLYSAMLHRPAIDANVRGVEVVVVAFGKPDLLRHALEAVGTLPVTVVDNSSQTAIRELCAELGCRYLDPGRNGGFAAGVNVALRSRQLPGADVLLLNPDAIISAADVALLQRTLQAEPDLASVGPAQVDGNGAAARVVWPFPSPGRTWLDAVGLARLGPQHEFVIGSVLLLRAEALDHVGGLDENFFLYAEETDWAYRAARLGWRHRVAPDVTAVHLGAATSSDSERRETHFHASQERYLRKHFGSLGWRVAQAGQIVGSIVRAAALPGERGAEAWVRAKRYLAGPLRRERQVAR